MKILQLIFINCMMISGYVQGAAQPHYNIHFQETTQERDLSVIHDQGQSIYTSQITLPSGEIAYFVSEPVFNEERARAWRNYRNWTGKLTDSNRGVIKGALLYRMKGQAFDSIERFFEDAPNELETFKQLIESVGDPKKLMNAIGGISSGVLGTSEQIGSRVNYISKFPVTGLFDFSHIPQDPNLHNQIGLYVRVFDSLIMIIDSYKSDNGGDYEHRGIFRNPISMLRNDYKNIATLLHGFTGWVWKIEHQEAENMTVSPDGNANMEAILKKAFNETIKTNPQRGGYIVPIDALLKHFKSYPFYEQKQ